MSTVVATPSSTALARAHDLDRRIAEMTTMKSTLLRLARCCQANQRSDSPMVDELVGS